MWPEDSNNDLFTVLMKEPAGDSGALDEGIQRIGYGPYNRWEARRVKEETGGAVHGAVNDWGEPGRILAGEGTGHGPITGNPACPRQGLGRSWA